MVPVTPRAPVAAGTVLAGAWRIEALVGEGGMGSVYRAVDLKLGREVAVKLLSGALLASPAFVRRFEHESRLLARLEHPSIVPIYAVGQEEAQPFFVMKHLRGESLRARLRGAPFSAPELLVLVTDLCSALDYVHGRGLVHRDIKPSNIFLGEDGRVTLLDFGISRDLSEETRSGFSLGTPAYMSPEQLTGQDVGPAADLYSLGVVIFELLTGTLPFHAESDIAVGYQHVHTPAPDPRETSPRVGPVMAEVVKRALAKDPSARHPSGAALAEAFAAALEEDRSPRPVPRRRGFQGRLAAAVASLGLMAVALGLFWPHHAPEKASAIVIASSTSAVPGVLPEPPAPKPVAVAIPEEEPAVTAAPAASKRLRLPRNAKLAELRVITLSMGQATWASLSVDGKPVGGTPAALHLPAGLHRLRVERPGFAPLEREVHLSPSSPVALQLELRR